MDPVDEKILNILRRNARTKYSTIARSLDLPEATVRYRIRNLEEKEVIIGYTTKEKFYGIKAFVLIRLEKNTDTTTVGLMITKIPGVISVYELAGEYDIICLIQATDIDSLNDHIESIRKVKEVLSTNTRIILKDINEVALTSEVEVLKEYK